MGLNATLLPGTLVRQNQMSGEYQLMNTPDSKTADKTADKATDKAADKAADRAAGKGDWKCTSIDVAKLLLNAAGNFVLDKLVGIGMLTGKIRAEDAPAARALIKNVAVKTFRYVYIDGPARCADKVVEDMAHSRLKQLYREASYRFFQASAIVFPLSTPYYDAIFRGNDALDRAIASKMFGGKKLQTE